MREGCETAVRSQESATCSDRSAGCWRNERAEETEEDAPPAAGLRLWSRSTRNNLGHSLQGVYRYTSVILTSINSWTKNVPYAPLVL